MMKRIRKGKKSPERQEAELPQRFRLQFLLQEIDLPAGEITIGRSPSCSITLEDPLVSRNHGRITVTVSEAVYNDLGSRNGTLVNGKPIFSDYALQDQDRITIGSNELVFLNVTHRTISRGKTTSYLRICPGCNVVFPEGQSNCPSCGLKVPPPEWFCPRCKRQAHVADTVCAACGTPLVADDTTIPAELGGATAGWRTSLITEVIEKALSSERYKQAEQLIDDLIRDFEQNTKKKKEIDRTALRRLTRFCLKLAEANADPKRIAWGLDWHRKHGLILHTSLVDLVERVAKKGESRLLVPVAAYLEDLHKRLGDETLRNDDRVQRLEQLVAGHLKK